MNKNSILKSKTVHKYFYILGVIFILAGCTSKEATYSSKYQSESKPIISDEVNRAFHNLPQNSEVLSSIKEGVDLLKNGEFKAANKAFEKGLRLNPTDANLHFFNALSYHLRSKNGNVKMLDLAETGYQTTLRFDKTNYWSAYLLGYIYFDQNRYFEAQNQFSYALMYAPKNPNILRALSVASYYANDLPMNNWAAQKAFRLDSKNVHSLRNLMFSQAAVGETNNAKRNLKKYTSMMETVDKSDSAYIKKLTYNTLHQRIDDWDNYHLIAKNDNKVFDTSKDNGLLKLDGINEDNYEPDSDESSDIPTISKQQTIKPSTKTIKTTQASSATKKVKKQKVKLPRMTLVDVVIIRTEESRSQAKGINLLDGLTATLSGTLIAYNNVSGARIFDNRFSFS